MIQRKQTIFLLLAVVAYVVCLFLPIGHIVAKGMALDTTVYNLGTVGGNNGTINIIGTCVPLFILDAVAALLSVVTIFMYNKRPLQMTLCAVTILFSCLWCVDYILLFLGLVQIPEVEGEFGMQFGACLPVVGIILVAMARKGVNDDEKLVKAADRIR